MRDIPVADHRGRHRKRVNVEGCCAQTTRQSVFVKWKARLRGHDFDLLSLMEIFADGDPTVSRSDDGGFVLESSAFDSLQEATEVSAAAAKLLTLLNGAAKGLDNSYRFVELAGHFQKEQGVHAVVLGETVTVRARANVGRVTIDGVAVSPSPSPAKEWPALAAANRNVADALRLLGTADLDWVGLYKLLEIVKDDVGGKRRIIDEGWATEQLLSEFGAAANRPDLSGDAARHARIGGRPPERAMTVGEGRQFVLALVRSWLQWKAAQRP